MFALQSVVTSQRVTSVNFALDVSVQFSSLILDLTITEIYQIQWLNCVLKHILAISVVHRYLTSVSISVVLQVVRTSR